MSKMPRYEIITKRKVNDETNVRLTSESETDMELFIEQEAKLKELGYTWNSEVYAHDFDDEEGCNDTIDGHIESLAIKDGVDLVRFENGNIGFVAYYNNWTNGFEILGKGKENEDE